MDNPDIIYNITLHLNPEDCISFLLMCKNNAKLLQKKCTRIISCGQDKFSVSSSVYKKVVAEYNIFKAYNKRKRCIERAVRSMFQRSYEYEYSEFAEKLVKSFGYELWMGLDKEEYTEANMFGFFGQYVCLDAFENCTITPTMFRNTKDIDKELPFPRYPIEENTYENEDSLDKD